MGNALGINVTPTSSINVISGYWEIDSFYNDSYTASGSIILNSGSSEVSAAIIHIESLEGSMPGPFIASTQMGTPTQLSMGGSSNNAYTWTFTLTQTQLRIQLSSRYSLSTSKPNLQISYVLFC